MDLNDLDIVTAANGGFELELKHPTTGALLGIFITVLGNDSDEFRKQYALQSKARLSRMGKRQSREPVPMEELERDAIKVLAACTVKWRDRDNPCLTIGTEMRSCSLVAAEALYTKFPWIKEQVDIAISDRANFIKG